jgi:hypothetical protein
MYKAVYPRRTSPKSEEAPSLQLRPMPEKFLLGEKHSPIDLREDLHEGEQQNLHKEKVHPEYD